MKIVQSFNVVPVSLKMLLEVDESALEWRVAAELSRDPLMLKEIKEGIDQHEKVRQEIFKGQVERVMAKIWNFRMLYMDESLKGYAYYMDPAMPNFSKRRWDDIVGGFFSRYSGFAKWHVQILKEVNKTGELHGPTGRRWVFHKTQGRYGMQYDKAKVYNYPIQGSAADVIKLYMKSMCSEIVNRPEIKLVNCVHDSLIFDLPENDVDWLAERCYTIGDLQKQALSEYFNIEWEVPLAVECKWGPNWAEMVTYERRK